jgi:AcrR family transcriptional regulator
MATSSARPRSRPAAEKWALPAQQARSRATRERVLDAAEKAFAEHGYENARISDIAKAARCSVGAVYFRFRDKDALFLAIAEDFAHETRARFSEFFNDTGSQPPAAIIRAFVLKTAANFRRHRGLFRAIVEHGFEHADAMRTMMVLREDVVRSLEHVLQDPRRPRVPVSTGIRVVVQMVFGFLLVGLLNPRAPTRIDDDKAVAGLADAAVAYFGSVQS